MSEFPSLSEVLAQHSRHGSLNCKCRAAIAPDGGYPERPTIEQHQADAWRETCTITTLEQLDALPTFSVVCDGGWANMILEKLPVFDAAPWCTAMVGPTNGQPSSELNLPALLIWHPDWARP